MKRFIGSIFIMMIIASNVAFAIDAPANIQAAFKKYYPEVELVIWSMDQGYYKGQFEYDGYNKSIWFNNQAQWVMEQTPLSSVDDVPPAVYNAFASCEYASWIVETVTLVNFPKWQPIFVIKVGQNNVEGMNQLFYQPNGNLLKIVDVTNEYGILEPSVFINNQ